LTTEVCGRKDGPVIGSWGFCAHLIGGSIAAIVAGAIRTETGSYMMAFVASGIACLMASLLVLRIARRPALVAAE
ncbi:MAG: MFS transporter, partial [Rhodospirillales bacterium]|nr:MFS transporter [Rhodospirillales bacterium]